MKNEIIFSMESPFRDTFRIQGFRFGEGEKSLAIVGAMRGNEIQQQYICSQTVSRLANLEKAGKLTPGHEILVIPSANPFSMNIEKRFWAMDNTDINRMFPGYNQGETTQRIAAALFEAIQGYTYGIQLASFYVPGDFVPHIRIIRTGYEDTASAALFGLPFICLHNPLPFDTTLLNYNWQIWGTKAFSLYSGGNDIVEGKAVTDCIHTILRFMQRTGLVNYTDYSSPDYNSRLMDEAELTAVRTPVSGILYKMKHACDAVKKNELMASVIDPYNGQVLMDIQAPTDGIVFFAHNKPLVLQNTVIYKIA